jgi:hypothetical protein
MMDTVHALTAALLEIGLVGKFLLTRHLQGHAIRGNKKNVPGKTTVSMFKVRTFTL